MPHASARPPSPLPSPRPGTADRRGIVLGIILLLLVILAVILFAHHWQVRDRNRQAARFADGELTARLAVEGLDFLASALQRSDICHGKKLKDEFLPGLFGPEDPRQIALGTGTCLPGGTPTAPDRWLDRVAADYQKCLETISHQYTDRLSLLGGGQTQHPLCQGMGITLRNITRVQEFPPKPLQLNGGWDGFERRGELVLSCKVYFMGMSRVAVTVRQFKLVSFLPGPCSRFTLFVQHAPNADCYNVVRNRYDGSPDPRAGGTNFRPLILYNSPAPLDDEQSTSLLKAQDELRTKGWVYLGQSPGGSWNRDPSTLQGMVSLRIPSGYLPEPGSPAIEETGPDAAGVGGHAYLCPPATVKNNEINVTPYPVSPAGLYKSDAPGGPWEVAMRFHGFFTEDPTTGDPQNKGAAGLGFWSGPFGPLKPEECTTSWIFPFGERRRLSRTLLFGAAFAEFLTFYALTGSTRCGVILPPPEPDDYDPTAPIRVSVPTASPPVAQDLFLPHPLDPPGKPGLTAWQSVAPRWIKPRSNPACAGFAANLLFDLTAHRELPDIGQSRSTQPWGIGKIPALSFAIPGNNQPGTLNEMDSISPAYHPCLQPLVNVHLWRHHDPPSLSPASDLNTLFLGDLQKLVVRNQNTRQPPFDEFTVTGLLSRVTHSIDLRGKSREQTAEILGRQLFSPVSDPGSPGTWETAKAGIFFLRRNPGEEQVFLPGRIRLAKPVILILEHGDLAVPDAIIDPEAAGPDKREKAPRVPCTLMALDGRLCIPGDKELHAYLVALNPSITEAPDQGGRLQALSPGGAGASSGGNRLQIKGGVAVVELAPGTGRSTMEDFSGGGVIRYNTLFNQSLPSVWETYGLVCEDRNGPTTIKGGEE